MNHLGNIATEGRIGEKTDVRILKNHEVHLLNPYGLEVFIGYAGTDTDKDRVLILMEGKEGKEYGITPDVLRGLADILDQHYENNPEALGGTK